MRQNLNVEVRIQFLLQISLQRYALAAPIRLYSVQFFVRILVQIRLRDNIRCSSRDLSWSQGLCFFLIEWPSEMIRHSDLADSRNHVRIDVVEQRGSIRVANNEYDALFVLLLEPALSSN